MSRLYVVVEGPTEESFVTAILAPSLWDRGIFLQPIILGTPGHKGGNVNFTRVKRDVVGLLKGDSGAFCSTMLDFYGLRKEGFPGFPLPPNLPSVEKAERVEQAMRGEIGQEAGIARPELRFIPYIQVHEYEALLFSDCGALASSVGQQSLAMELQKIREAFPTPEDIDDHPETAPSKRILGLYPAYRKVLDGTLAAQRVGLKAMKAECQHFREWLERIGAV